MQQSDPLKARLTGYSPPLAALSRMLGDAPQTPLFGMAGVTLARAASANHADRAWVRPARLRFVCQHGAIDVLFDTHGYPALESIASDDNAVRRVALINLWLNAQMETARRAGVDSLHVADIALCEEREQAGLALTLDGVTPPLHCVVTSVPASLIEACNARSATAAADERFFAAFHDVRLPGRLCIAQRTCKTRILNALRAGDVLLGWNVSHPAAGNAPIAAQIAWGSRSGSQLAARVEIQGNHVTFVTEPTMNQDAFDAANFDTPADALATPQAESVEASHADQPLLSELDLPVQLEIGTLDLPLRTLATLQPGTLLELPVALEDARVRLVVHGQTIGTGRLVAIGEHLGLQIAEIGKA
ncbi:type III secretion system cytoplasmic ring protein SctQ [Paraburkholderia bannensis]|uniref:type III secretion system cytoplasmic ring protein SctQ n=1 Tax=Paraburkholderia bannensis TaxID=765414 RepID=UPI002ABE0AA9|nr:type III secretion system cytoplasmic ring protein SctQ [Paraburkholderia bannensis]